METKTQPTVKTGAGQPENLPQKITPFLWFDNQAEEAVNFYVSVFLKAARFSKASSFRTGHTGIQTIARYDEAGAGVSGRKAGSVMTVAFQLNGQEFVALNGGPVFKITPAVSFVVNCETQEEVDHFWNSLTEGGDEKAQQCGWLQDRFGVSWQIVPLALSELLSDPDHEKTARVMQAMLQMKKIDIGKLKKAYSQ
jgi:predicted 3-demethylubiquinone-9 3-methyltransferase (glyoxalase superfamily)